MNYTFKFLPLDSTHVTQETLEELVSFESLEFEFPWTLKQWEMSLNMELEHFGVARDELGEIVGFSLYRLEENGVLYLLKIVVKSCLREGGIGRHLFAGMCHQAPDSTSEIYLEVESSNEAALTFYQRFGAKTLHFARNYYGDSRNAYKLSIPFKKKW
jgi:ribosomal protein S18 acetylase RimI-like enzyme